MSKDIKVELSKYISEYLTTVEDDSIEDGWYNFSINLKYKKGKIIGFNFPQLHLMWKVNE